MPSLSKGGHLGHLGGDGRVSAERTHISLIAIPDAVISTLSGIYDVLGSFSVVSAIEHSVPAAAPFEVEIVGETNGPVMLASGLPITPHRSIDQITTTDIVIVPSVLVPGDDWKTGRYPALIEWLTTMHQRGATLCSACSGVFLLAETGLFDGKLATVHWGYAAKFRKTFPQVPIAPEKVLLVTGERREFITSGASTSWHDLVLYLLSHRVGPAATLAIARFFALEWHRDGLAPYILFVPPRDHGDASILAAQDWLAARYSVASPVEEMVRLSGLAERTFKRRFSNATGFSPIAYVQHLRIEEAKRRLESTRVSIDEISWNVGYEDPVFFRRLFKRITGLTPGAYRRKFNLAAFAK